MKGKLINESLLANTEELPDLEVKRQTLNSEESCGGERDDKGDCIASLVNQRGLGDICQASIKNLGNSKEKVSDSSSFDLACEERNKRRNQLLARDRLLPCIQLYDELVDEIINDIGGDIVLARLMAMNRLTECFRNSYDVVLRQIEASGKTGISLINSVKRSAGTNYQGLVEYAILMYLSEIRSTLTICCNSPKELKNELTIYGVDSDDDSFSVEPDIDMCIYQPNADCTSPIVLLSAKTSIVDRGGQAARWKMYLDLHQTTCPHITQICDCPVNRTKVVMKTKRKIVHAIITANIYKIETTQPEGELGNAQCRNNTFMFNYKYTTRSDRQQFVPDSWSGLSEIGDMLNRVYDQPIN